MLYFVSTLGSALGTLGTSFYFVLWFDINTVMWGCVAALLLCAAVVLGTCRSPSLPETEHSAAIPEVSP